MADDRKQELLARAARARAKADALRKKFLELRAARDFRCHFAELAAAEAHADAVELEDEVRKENIKEVIRLMELVAQLTDSQLARDAARLWQKELVRRDLFRDLIGGDPKTVAAVLKEGITGVLGITEKPVIKRSHVPSTFCWDGWRDFLLGIHTWAILRLMNTLLHEAHHVAQGSDDRPGHESLGRDGSLATAATGDTVLALRQALARWSSELPSNEQRLVAAIKFLRSCLKGKVLEDWRLAIWEARQIEDGGGEGLATELTRRMKKLESESFVWQPDHASGAWDAGGMAAVPSGGPFGASGIGLPPGGLPVLPSGVAGSSTHAGQGLAPTVDLSGGHPYSGDDVAPDTQAGFPERVAPPAGLTDASGPFGARAPMALAPADIPLPTGEPSTGMVSGGYTVGPPGGPDEDDSPEPAPEGVPGGLPVDPAESGGNELRYLVWDLLNVQGYEPGHYGEDPF